MEENDDNEPTQDEFGQTVPISDAHQEEETEKEEPETESTLSMEQKPNTDNQQNPTDVEDQEEEESMMFNILMTMQRHGRRQHE